MQPDAMTDGFGLPLTTNAESAALYDLGTRQLLGGDSRALSSYRAALRADPQFALAHAGAAAVLHSTGGPFMQSVTAARRMTRRTTRRERQHVEIVAAALGGDARRALALCAEHLHEYPSDIVALHVVTNAVAAAGDETLRAELLALVAVVIPWDSEP
jgi:DNA-binding GntR family transcriptional regulator